MGEQYKRFMVFAYSGGDGDEASGGLGDCDRSFDTLEEAVEAAETLATSRFRARDGGYDTVNVFDRIEGRVVWEKS